MFRRWKLPSVKHSMKILLLAFVILGVAGTGTFALDQMLQRQASEKRKEKEIALRARIRSERQAIPAGVTLPGFSRQSFADSIALPISLPRIIGPGSISLAEFRGRKPVVLIFGSFGCDLLAEQWDRLAGLQHSYGKRAEFILVCIKEAPHADVIPVGPGQAAEGRVEFIRRRFETLRLPFSCVVDGADGAVEKSYHAFPARLMVIDKTGKIALDLGNIIYGWDLNRVETWLKNEQNEHPKTDA